MEAQFIRDSPLGLSEETGSKFLSPNPNPAVGPALVGRWRRVKVGATTTQATACKEA